MPSEVDVSAWAMAFVKATLCEHRALCFSLDHAMKYSGDFEESASGRYDSDANTKQSVPPNYNLLNIIDRLCAAKLGYICIHVVTQYQPR